MIVLVLALTSAYASPDRFESSSPVDFTTEDIGALLDENFRGLAQGGSILREGANPRQTPGEGRAAWSIESAAMAAKAAGGLSGGVWSASAGVSTSSEEVVGIYRAFQASSVLTVQPSDLRAEPVPAGAAWYVEQLYVGRMYEVVCAGTRTSLEGHAKAGLLLPGAGSVEVGGEKSNNAAQCANRTLGLKARSGTENIMLSNGMNVDQAFEADGEPRVVVVRYARIPDHLVHDTDRARKAEAQTAKEPTSFELVLVDTTFPRYKPDTWSWDVMSGLPDISVWAKIEGKVVFRSAVANETLLAQFNQSVLTGISRGDERVLEFTLVDMDATEPDPAGRFEVSLPTLFEHYDKGKPYTVKTDHYLTEATLTLRPTP